MDTNRNLLGLGIRPGVQCSHLAIPGVEQSVGVQTLAHLRNSGQIEPIVGSFLHLTSLSQGTQNPSLH
jgi:hypothetical protein